LCGQPAHLVGPPRVRFDAGVRHQSRGGLQRIGHRFPTLRACCDPRVLRGRFVPGVAICNSPPQDLGWTKCSFRSTIENVRRYTTSTPPIAHEVLAAVLQVRDSALCVLLWRRALDPHIGRWSLPGGQLRADEDVETSIRRHLAEKVDLTQLKHAEE